MKNHKYAFKIRIFSGNTYTAKSAKEICLFIQKLRIFSQNGNFLLKFAEIQQIWVEQSHFSKFE